VELYQLQSFITIAREANLTRAAEKLHLSQSALSSQIRHLEGDLGVTLFRRTTRGMELTEVGRELIPLAEGALESAQKIRRRAMALHQGVSDSVAIGLNADPTFLRIGAINRRLSLLHRDLNVIFLTSQTVRTAQMLRQGELDLAFFYGEASDADIARTLLARVRICVVIPTRLSAGRESIDWEEIAALPWIWAGAESPFYSALADQLTQRRLRPNQAVETMDERIIKELVMDAQGLAVMREDEARPLAEGGRVTIWDKGWMTVPLSLAWLEKNGEKKRVRAARDAIRHIWQRDDGAAEGASPYWL
jgi:DNA-binding transcriptional LysR family regulator